MSEAAVLLTALQAELDVFTQRLAAGFDVAPARRARFEGMAAAALALGIDSEVLLQSCRDHLPVDAQLVVEAGHAPRLDIWQQRAPVEPSTGDV
jgi:GTP cyclohydrolase III